MGKVLKFVTLDRGLRKKRKKNFVEKKQTQKHLF